MDFSSEAACQVLSAAFQVLSKPGSLGCKDHINPATHIDNGVGAIKVHLSNFIMK